MKTLLSFIVALVLTGCASPHSDLLFKDKPLLSAQSGLVVASFGTRSSVQIYFRPVADPNGREQIMTTDGHSWAGGGRRDQEVVRSSSDGSRLLVGYSLKPGRYQITKASVSVVSAATYTAELKMPPNQEFEVFASGVSYVGSFQANIRTGTTVLGMTVPSKVSMSVRNEMPADLALLFRVRPELASMPTFSYASVQ